MKEKNSGSFFLQPFPPGDPWPPLDIIGGIIRGASTFAMHYMLLGRLEDLVIPEPAAIPVRKNGLWEETCFELFLGVKDSPLYWEINLSPSGQWNIFRFADYRQGMREETALKPVLFTVQTRPGTIFISLELNLAEVLEANQPVELGFSAVIRHRNGEVTYWALNHLGPRPDFHRRDGFTIPM